MGFLGHGSGVNTVFIFFKKLLKLSFFCEKTKSPYLLLKVSLEPLTRSPTTNNILRNGLRIDKGILTNAFLRPFLPDGLFLIFFHTSKMGDSDNAATDPSAAPPATPITLRTLSILLPC